jgi:3-oxoacyl-[acyl-carrier-protein] synthase I
MGQPIAIAGTGLVTSVGLSAPAACAAIRAGVTNPTESRFLASNGEWIMAHGVPFEESWRGRLRQVKMVAMAIEECLSAVPRDEWPAIPVILCVAEAERPGRLEGLDDELLAELQREVAVAASESAIVAHGRVGAAVALRHARSLLYERDFRQVVIAGVDSLLTWPTLRVYESDDRLLLAGNSNGFMPGEAAGALLVERPAGKTRLVCTGLGFGTEPSPISSDEPLRGEGLTQAIAGALADADCRFHDLDFRITDIAGEQYYFKEAALAVGRLLRVRKDEFDIWHPAECIGESGAAAGIVLVAVADAACHKEYAPGARILTHMANDSGQRAAAVFHFGSF